MPRKAQKDGAENVEPRTYHVDKNTKKSRKTGQETWEDALNEFVKGEETETTQSNDLRTVLHGLLF